MLARRHALPGAIATPCLNAASPSFGSRYFRLPSSTRRSHNSAADNSRRIPEPPRRDLFGRVAIVTGAGSRGDELGVGRAVAMLLARDGAAVVCVDRNLGHAQRTVEMLRNHDTPQQQQKQPPRAIAVEADVTRDTDCAAAVSQALNAFGRVDVLVNSVGVLGPPGTAVEVECQEWARGMEINVTSMMLMARHSIPAMRKNQGSLASSRRAGQEDDGHSALCGSIVNIGSVAGLRGGTPSLLYPTSKGAVVNMTRAMAAHHGAEGIRVNCVCPGMLYTPMVCGANGMSPETREARRRRSLLRTEGNAWDCATAVRFLAGDEARWITGSILTVDAGATAAVSINLS
ncbi:hypothetical protein VTK73DRAFT_3633 [Phialemonium thermophilum]|uniref:Uncharacterized protein n=1 Tax=Phialemonium thermophilum TaxID=223376 RepID=A0ABR3WYL7_9PEZI